MKNKFVPYQESGSNSCIYLTQFTQNANIIKRKEKKNPLLFLYIFVDLTFVGLKDGDIDH